MLIKPRLPTVNGLVIFNCKIKINIPCLNIIVVPHQSIRSNFLTVGINFTIFILTSNCTDKTFKYIQGARLMWTTFWHRSNPVGSLELLRFYVSSKNGTVIKVYIIIFYLWQSSCTWLIKSVHPLNINVVMYFFCYCWIIQLMVKIPN